MHPLMDGHPHRFATDFEQTLLGKASDTAGGWVPTSLPGHVNAFGEAGVPTPGLEGGVGCNSRVTFDGKVRNLGQRANCFVSSNPPYLRTTEPTASRQQTVSAANSAGAPSGSKGMYFVVMSF